MRAACLAGVMLFGLAGPAAAQSVTEEWPYTNEGLSEWQVRKCVLYREAWAQAAKRRGTAGLGAAFLERHAAFLAAGCVGARDVCPKTAAELDMANVLVILGMNAGMASTFFPFGCPKAP